MIGRGAYFVYLIFIEKGDYGFTTSTRPITVHERTATYKSQLEAIIKKPGNTRGVAGGLYLGLVSSVTQAIASVCDTTLLSIRYLLFVVSEINITVTVKLIKSYFLHPSFDLIG